MSKKSPSVYHRFIPFTIHFRAVQPLPRRGVLMRNFVDNGDTTGSGQIVINVQKPPTSGAQDFAAVVGDLAAVLDLPMNFGAVPAEAKLTPVPLTPNAFTRNADVTRVPNNGPRNNNYQILIAAYDNTGARIETERFGFVAVPPRATVNVNCTASLFLAYAGFGAPTPNGEKLPDSAPSEVIAPIDAAMVHLRVEQIGGVDQTWSYNGADFTNAIGELRSEAELGFANPNTTSLDYVKSFLGSDHIKPSFIPLSHNRLVAMWDFGPENASSDPLACQETDVGMANDLVLPSIGFPPDALKPINLMLASHAIGSWANNTGSLKVTLEWIL